MFGLTKREQRWKAEQKAAETIAGVLVAAINAKSHKGEEMNKSEQLIACLEGEIAKRDEELAACRVAVENCDVFRARIAELEEKLAADDDANFNLRGLLQRGAFALGLDPENTSWFEVIGDLEKQSAGFAAIKAQEPVAAVKHGPLDSDGWPEFARVETIGDFDLENLPSGMKLYAAPAAPAADAGLVDMYRHLQKVTPYRFKKIQDASITDGGDVMYFHKDRFDAALLADMAAHCANGVV